MSTVAQLFDQLGDAVGAKVSGLETSLNAVIAARGDMTALPTAHKATLTGSISEIHSGLVSAQQTMQANQAALANKAEIDDTTAATDSVYSSAKTLDAIIAAVQALDDKLTNGAGSALDSFKEFEDLVASYPDFNTMLADLGGAVSFAKVQSIPAEGQQIARDNISAPSNAQLNTVDAKFGTIETADPVGQFNQHFA